MKNKKIVSVIMASTLIASGAFATDNNSVLEKSSSGMEVAFNRAYMKGYDGNIIKPDGEITRAEALTLVVRLKEKSMEIKSGKSSDYSDVEEGAWYKKEVDYGTEKGIIKGYPDGTFKPDSPITRAEFVQLLLDLDKKTDSKSSFPDVSEDHWAKPAIDVLFGNGRVEGYKDGTFAPDKNITRAESVKILNGVFERVMTESKLSDIKENELKKFSDLDSEHWGYYNLVGATNDYQSKGKGDKENVTRIITKDELKRADSYIVSEDEALKELGLDKKIDSIVAFSWTDALTMIESGSNIAGIPDDHHIDESIHEKYELITDEEGKIDYAKLEKIKPATAFVSESTLKANEGLEEKLKEIGTEIFYRETKTVDDLFKTAGFIASASGTKESAVSNLLNLFSRADAVKAKSDENENPKVALINMTEEDGKIVYSVPAKGTFSAELMELGGMKNSGDSVTGESDRFGYVKTELSKIMEEDPDAVVVMVRTARDKRNEHEQEFYKELKEKYSDKKAVKNEKYGRIDHHGVLPKTPMVLSGLEAISGIANKTDNVVPDKLKDGVYDGVGTGYSGGLKTKVEVKSGKISSIDITENNETSNILALAKDKIISAIIDKQSTKVDTVSGATRSSEGIMESVANALSKAK